MTSYFSFFDSSNENTLLVCKVIIDIGAEPSSSCTGSFSSPHVSTSFHICLLLKTFETLKAVEEEGCAVAFIVLFFF